MMLSLKPAGRAGVCLSLLVACALTVAVLSSCVPGGFDSSAGTTPRAPVTASPALPSFEQVRAFAAEELASTAHSSETLIVSQLPCFDDGAGKGAVFSVASEDGTSLYVAWEHETLRLLPRTGACLECHEAVPTEPIQ